MSASDINYFKADDKLLTYQNDLEGITSEGEMAAYEILSKRQMHIKSNH